MANLITNSTFEANTTGWTADSSMAISRSNAQAHGGTWSLLCNASAADDTVSFTTVAVSPNTLYTISGWIYVSSGDQIKMGFNEWSDNGNTYICTADQVWRNIPTGSWKYFAFTSKLSTTTQYVTPHFGCGADVVTDIYLDDPSLDQAAAVTFPKSSVLESFGGALGGSWTNSAFGLGAIAVSSGAATGPAAQSGAAHYNAASYGPDQEVGCTVSTVGASGDTVKLHLNSSSSANSWTGYFLMWDPAGSNTASVWKHTGVGAETVFVESLGNLVNAADAINPTGAGDKIGFERINNLLSVYYKPSAGSWTHLVTMQDISYTSGGYAGFEVYNTGTKVDDFFAGNVTAWIPETNAPGKLRSLPISSGIGR